MSDVVAFPKKEREIFICECGCVSFLIFDDGSAACTSCENVMSGEVGSWLEEVKEVSAVDVPEKNISGNGSLDFHLAYMRRQVASDDVAAILVIKTSGQISVWGDAEGEDQRDWLRRYLDSAVEMFRETFL